MSPSSTSSSDTAGLGRFCLQLALFLAPVLVIVALFESTFWAAGESWPMARIAAAHEGRETLLVRPQYFAQSYRFKFDRVRALQPDVICLGTSRVLQIRGLLFAPGTKFYNGGGMLGSFADIQAYAQAVADGTLPKPKVAIFGVEPWWIKEGLPPANPTWETDSQYADSFYIPEAHIAAMRVLLKKEGLPWPGKLGFAYTPAPHSGYPAVGVAALSKGVGFRIDGSYQYDPELIASYFTKAEYQDRETPPVIERLRKNSEQFTPSRDLDHGRFDSMLASFQKLRGLGVQVLVILPPFANECHDYLESKPPTQAWWPKYKTWAPEKLTAAGFPCVAPGCPRDYQLEDTTMWDGFHPSEVLMARVIRSLSLKCPEGSPMRGLISPELEQLARFIDHPLTLEPNLFKP